MNHRQKHLSSCLIVLAASISTAPWAQAQTAPGLGTASPFAVLSAAPGGAGAVTCTTSTVNGDVGSSGPAASVVNTGCTINGDVIAPVPAQVVTDFNTAYGQYPGIACGPGVITGATQTLTPGVYCTPAALTFAGGAILTLDALGDPNAVWIFKIGTSGTGALTGTNISVVMANGGQSCNVNWWVAQAATMTTSSFQGNILAGAAITLTSTSLNGDALARAAVTLTTGTTVTGCEQMICEKPDKSHGTYMGQPNYRANPYGPPPKPPKCHPPKPPKPICPIHPNHPTPPSHPSHPSHAIKL